MIVFHAQTCPSIKRFSMTYWKKNPRMLSSQFSFILRSSILLMSTTMMGRKWQSLPQKQTVPCLQHYQKNTRCLRVGSEISNGIIFFCQSWYFSSAAMQSQQLNEVAWRNLSKKSSGNPFRYALLYYLLRFSLRIFIRCIQDSSNGTPPPKIILWFIPFLSSTILSAELDGCYGWGNKEMLNLESADILRSLQRNGIIKLNQYYSWPLAELQPNSRFPNHKSTLGQLIRKKRLFFILFHFYKVQILIFEARTDMGKAKTIFSSHRQQNKKKYYTVERILERKVGTDGSIMYKVRWEGYTQEYDTWQPLKHLEKVTDLVKAFDKKAGKKRVKRVRVKIQKIRKAPKLNSPPLNDSKNQKAQQTHEPTITGIVQTKVQQPIQLKRQQDRQNQNQSLPDESYYRVEKIVDKKFNSTKKVNYYRVRWSGFQESDDTWEPIENLGSVLHLVEAFNNPAKSKKIKKSSKAPKFYRVQRIVDKKMVNEQQYYRVRWSGYTEAEDTWEPLANVISVGALVQNFNKQYDKKVRTSDEIECTLKETDNYEIGGVCQEELMEEIGLVGLVEEDRESNFQIDEQFISLNVHESQLIEPDFL